MQHLVDLINDEYLYDYMEALLADPTTDESILKEVFETWGFPAHLLPTVISSRKLILSPQPAPAPATNHIPKTQDLSSLFSSEERKPIRHSHVPPEIKRTILNSYDLRPITTAPCNPTLQVSPSDKTKNKIRYHNNQIVTNKGEKYIDLTKQKNS